MLNLITLMVALLASSNLPCGNIPWIPTSNSTMLTQNGNFVSLYDYDMLNPAWTSIYLTYENVKNDMGGRKDFNLDPEAKYQAHVDNAAFKLPFNHGHLIESYIVSYDKSKQGSWHDCYYMTNIAPQYGDFNQYCWALVENKTRDFIMLKELDLYMLTGVAYKDRTNPTRVDGVAIPDYFWKVLITEDCSECVAFYGRNVQKYSDDCTVKTDVAEVEGLFGGEIFDCEYDDEFWKDL